MLSSLPWSSVQPGYWNHVVNCSHFSLCRQFCVSRPIRPRTHPANSETNNKTSAIGDRRRFSLWHKCTIIQAHRATEAVICRNQKSISQNVYTVGHKTVPLFKDNDNVGKSESLLVVIISLLHSETNFGLSRSKTFCLPWNPVLRYLALRNLSTRLYTFTGVI